MLFEATQRDDLIHENESRQQDCSKDGQSWLRNGESKAGGGQIVRLRAPEDYGDGDPLKRDGRGVENKTVGLRGARCFHELANSAPAEQRHSRSKNEQDEREVPVHRCMKTLLLHAGKPDGRERAGNRG